MVRVEIQLDELEWQALVSLAASEARTPEGEVLALLRVALRCWIDVREARPLPPVKSGE